MNIGLVDVDGHSGYPNLALMRISAYHKTKGDRVEWADPMFGHYDRVYQSKVFTFTPPHRYEYDCEVIKGGTGFGMYNNLPDEIDCVPPDYSIYGIEGTSYGFTTRGCINKCSFCIVPKKEGIIRPYRDITDIAQGNTNIILMDNNILAHPHGIEQLKIAAERGYKIDINQGLDARLVTDEIAQILARCKWIRYIRTACDSHTQIPHIERMHQLLAKYGYKKEIFCYCLIKDFDETIDRISWARQHHWLSLHCQPYRDFNNPNQVIPQWQKDLARYTNRRWFYRTIDFADFEPRKGFKCSQYFQTVK